MDVFDDELVRFTNICYWGGTGFCYAKANQNDLG